MKAQEASSPFWGRSEYYSFFFFFPLPDLRALRNPIKRSSICWVYVSCEPALSVGAKFLIYICACTRAVQPLPAKWRNDTPKCSPGAPGVDVTVSWLSELLWFDLHLIRFSFWSCGLFSVANGWQWNWSVLGAHCETARSQTSACFIVERMANLTADSLVCAFIPVGILI